MTKNTTAKKSAKARIEIHYRLEREDRRRRQRSRRQGKLLRKRRTEH